MKKRFQTYNDGFLYVCTSRMTESDFNAVRNATQETELTKLLKLAYTELSKRDEDMDFAESQGRTLSLKVKTRFHPLVNKMLMVLIEDTLYSIVKLDPDREKREMYFYLEEVRKIERAE